MQTIELNNIRVFTNHGCMQEEALIGSPYRVDLKVYADLRTSAVSDDLKDTVDYVSLHKIVKEEMAQRSKLLEHVAQRIIDRIFKEEQMVQRAVVHVAKINPPIGGDVETVTVGLDQKR